MELTVIKKSLNNVTFISNYNKKTMSNLHNTNSTETDMENLKALRASIIKNDKKSSSEEIVYKIENFFIDDDPFGITLKKDLKQVIEETNDRGFEGLVLFFKYAFQRRRFQLSTPLKDKEGKLYYWAIIKEGMCDIGFKIPIFPGIDRILRSREKVAMYITMEEILEKLK
ncbi:hypothetical protein MUK51_18425 [Sphingobacterium faecium]|uniref:hypothetical protein n=1 Tax=Sphingobacterium faecium TaxID=34087 RepID=UPI0021B53E3C|nr:hypothetical protein [Sphingobacterium faecium]UXD69156.1 hypothetical protein MUK51_18425 [Sphingobacterium faecium]